MYSLPADPINQLGFNQSISEAAAISWGLESIKDQFDRVRGLKLEKNRRQDGLPC
jgi:hypothetical protein